MEVEVVAMSNMRPMGRGAAAAVGLSLVLAFSAPAATAPTPTPAWTTDVQMDVRTGSVAADRDGNSYVAGSRGTTAPIAVLEKFDPDGALVWTRTWSPEGGRTHSSGGLVAVAPDGSVYLAGSVSSHYEGGGWFLRKYTLRWSAGLGSRRTRLGARTRIRHPDGPGREPSPGRAERLLARVLR